MTQKILSPSLSIASHHYFHTRERPWCVEPSWGRSSLTIRPIRLLNPPLSSPHCWPSPRRLPLTDLACLCPPLAVEVSNASRHRDTLRQLSAPSAEAALHHALPTNRGRSSAVPSPSIRWDGTLVCTAEVQRHRQDPSATLLTFRGGFHCPRVTAQTCKAHNNQRWACLFIYAYFLPLFVSCFALIWFVLFDYSYVSIRGCWCADEVKLALLVLGLALLLVLFREFVIDAVLLSAAVWVLIWIEYMLILLFPDWICFMPLLAPQLQCLQRDCSHQ